MYWFVSDMETGKRWVFNNRKRYEISETYKVERVCGRGNEWEDSGW